MWEFRNRNVFGATAFSTYGGFWLSLGVFVILAETTSSAAALKGPDVLNSLAWFLLAFAIFNTYMLLWSTRVSVAVFAVFATLEVDRDPPRDRLLPRGARRQRLHHARRRLGRHRHRRLRVVRVGRGRHQRHVARPAGAARWLAALGRDSRRITPGFTDAAAEGGSGWPLKHRTHAIDTMLLEERRYPPPEEFAAQANAQPRDLRPGPRRVLGDGGARACHVVRAVHDRLRVGPAVREVVRRRQAQRDVQLRRPARRGRQRRQGRVPLGRRAGGRPARRSRSPISSARRRSSRTR